MPNFFDSHASNYIVSIAAKVSKAEKDIIKKGDTKSLIKLFNIVEKHGIEIDEAIYEFYEQAKIKKGAN